MQYIKIEEEMGLVHAKLRDTKLAGFGGSEKIYEGLKEINLCM